LIAALLTVACAAAALTTERPRSPENQAVEKALVFLEKEAIQWKKERHCISCHQGTMAIWVLSEAKGQGFNVSTDGLAEMNHSTFGETGALIKAGIVSDPAKPVDPQSGFNIVSLSSFNLAMASRFVPSLDKVSRQELDLMVRDIVKHQEADGSWSGPPPGNGPPPVFESTEVMTLRCMLALETYQPTDSSLSVSLRDCLEKANRWLKQNKPADTTQTAALRLLVDVQAGKRGKALASGIKGLLKKQNTDGGWGPTRELPSDAYATGQALYALSLAGVRNNRAQIEQARAFLITSQRPDGSWLMIPRAHPGKTPFKNPAPIIYFGSSWATLGLLHSMPKELTRNMGTTPGFALPPHEQVRQPDARLP
jgi:squalene-hopene/tetraprenyl-beta-curcumene cyclase